MTYFKNISWAAPTFVRKKTISVIAWIFEKLVFELLCTFHWKQRIVQANRTYACNESTDKSGSFYKQTLKNLVRHVGDIIFNFESFKKVPQDTASYPYRKDGITYELAEGSKSTLQRMQNGGIFLTAHYGNYEAIGPWLCRLGIPLKASYIPLRPRWLNRLVEQKIRAVDGKSYAINAQNPRTFLRLLDEGKLFCLLMDQDSRIASAMDATFLGKDVQVNPLPDFLLKHRPHTPVYICWMEESDDTRRKTLHAVEVTGITKETTKTKSVAEIFNRWLEERIAENPTLWYGWTHRRFYSKNPEIYD